MKTRRSNDIDQAFILSTDNLKKLVRLIEKHVDIRKIGIVTYCRDQITREFETIEELIEYENPKSKEIYRIDTSIHGKDVNASINEESSEYITVTFAGDSNWSSVTIYVDGSEYLIFTLNKEIEGVISGMRPWYSPLLGNKSFILIGVTIGTIYCLLFDFSIYPIFQKSTNPLHKIVIFFIPLIVLFILCIIFIGKAFNYLFPRVVFTIGQGKQRFEYRQKVLKGLIGLITTIIGGLAIWLLTK